MLQCLYTVKARKLKLCQNMPPREHPKSNKVSKLHDYFKTYGYIKFGFGKWMDFAKGWSHRCKKR